MTTTQINYTKWMDYIRGMDVNISGREQCKLWYLRKRLEWTMSLPPFSSNKGAYVRNEMDLFIYRAALRFMVARLSDYIESGERRPPYSSLLTP